MANMFHCYEARRQLTDDELLDILHDNGVAVTKFTEQLRASGTEVDAIKHIQGAIVLMCAAIQVYAPDMINFDYSAVADRTIEAWKLLSKGALHETTD